jgi:hypothetical protein
MGHGRVTKREMKSRPIGTASLISSLNNQLPTINYLDRLPPLFGNIPARESRHKNSPPPIPFRPPRQPQLFSKEFADGFPVNNRCRSVGEY